MATVHGDRQRAVGVLVHDQLARGYVREGMGVGGEAPPVPDLHLHATAQPQAATRQALVLHVERDVPEAVAQKRVGHERALLLAPARRTMPILTGIGTVLSDDPALTCRLPGMTRQSPVRVVLDRDLRLPLTSTLATTAKQVPVWVFCGEHPPTDRERALGAMGIVVLRTKTGEGGLDLHEVVQSLGTRGITRLMVEAGPKLSASFFRADLVDEALLLRGPRRSARTAIDALDGVPLSALTGSLRLKQTGTERVGADTHSISSGPRCSPASSAISALSTTFIWASTNAPFLHLLQL